MSHTKDIKQIRRKAEKAGWTVEMRSSGHWKWTHPNGGFFYSSSSPGDFMVIRKIKARISKISAGGTVRL